MKLLHLASATLLGAGLLAGCGSDTSTAPLSVQIQLGQHQVPGGTPISGVAILTNNTSKSIPLDTCPQDWFQVGLANGEIHFEPGTPLDLCRVSNGHVAPGSHRVPLEVETLYSGCSGTPSPSAPACTPFGIPPLPPGRYEVKVIMSGLPPGTPLPASDWVTVTSPIPSVPASQPHGTIVVNAPYCSNTALGPPHVEVAIWRDQTLLGVMSGPGSKPFVFRVAPGRYILRSSTKKQAEATVTIGSTAHVDLVKVCHY